MYASAGSHFALNSEDGDNLLSARARIRCLCGFPILSGSMIQCVDSHCRVLQHTHCVKVRDEPSVITPPVPPQFYCDICRVNRADPFWVTVAQPLYAIKLAASDTINEVTESFHLAAAEKNLLQNTEYDVQVWCILLNDKVPFRIHWPQYAKLQINDIGIQTHNRPDSCPLGANGRDDCPLVKACMRDGKNIITLTVRDSRTFCFGVRVVKRRTPSQILELISNQQEEKWEDALARVRHCIGGGSAVDSNDGDLEVVSNSIIVTIRCPIGGSRIRIAGRFKPCTHMGCFNLETFIEFTQRTKKWQCPICLRNYSLESICTDPYFNRITSMLQYCEDDVTEVEIKPDGCWRVKDETRCRMDLAKWHYPDSTIYTDGVGGNIQLESGPLSSSLAINGSDGVLGFQTSSHDSGELSALQPIVLARSATPLHIDNDARLPYNPSAASAGVEMVILSDSDDENENLVSSGAVDQFGQAVVGETSQNVPYTGGWDSSNLYHGVPGGISADNGTNLGNQVSGVEVGLSFPIITARVSK